MPCDARSTARCTMQFS